MATATKNLDLVLESPQAAEYQSCWVRLEQIIPDESTTAPNVADIYNLWLAAATGRSAQKLRPATCPVEFNGNTITSFLGFYVWQSDPGLQYSLVAALGKIGQRMSVSKRREFSVFLDNVDRYALPYYMQSVSVAWETPTLNNLGERYTIKPTWKVVDGIWLVFSKPVFAAIRISGQAIGAAVVLEMSVKKGITTSDDITEADLEEWRRGPNGEIIINAAPTSKLVVDIIRDLKNTITVVWSCPYGLDSDSVKDDELENTSTTADQVDVVLPQCLSDLLSFCPDPFLGLDENTNLWCDELTNENVYYNACKGNVLGSREEKDGQSYCSRVAAPTSATTATWLPEGWSR